MRGARCLIQKFIVALFTTCVILYCSIVRIKDSDYLFPASVCVTSPLFVTLLRTFLFSIQLDFTRVERKNISARLYAEKSQKPILKGVFLLLYLSQVFIFVRQALQKIILGLFLSRITFSSSRTHTLVVQKASAGGSVIEDSRSLKLTCGFIVRTEPYLKCCFG